MRIIISFPTETAHSVRARELIFEISNFLTTNGISGNFHLTGDFARALRRTGRVDIVESLKKHELGYHCDKHGADPFMAGYLEENDWDVGVSNFLGNELPGYRLLEELMGLAPKYYTTEFTKAPQAVYGAYLMGMGIGFTRAPFGHNEAIWFCNAFAPNSENILGLEFLHKEEDSVETVMKLVNERIQKQKANGVNVLRMSLHEYRYLIPDDDAMAHHPDFYKRDGLNYECWPEFPMRSETATRRVLDLFKNVMLRIKNSDGVKFSSFSQFKEMFVDNSGVWVSKEMTLKLTKFLLGTLDAFTCDSISISPAEALALLVRSLREYRESGAIPDSVYLRNAIGPVENVHSSTPAKLNAKRILEALPQIDRFIDDNGYVPHCVHVGEVQLGPAAFLKSLVDLFLTILKDGRLPDVIESKEEELPVISGEPFFQQSTFTHKHRGLELYPDGFTGEGICEKCRLQSWSWKPALRR